MVTITRNIISLVILIVLPLTLSAEGVTKHYSWAAYIIDEHNQPVPYANVVLIEMNRGGVSDEAGYIRLDHLPKGKFEVGVTVIGYVPKTAVISLPQAPGEKTTIMLSHTILEGSVVTVSVTGLPTDILHSERTVSVLEGNDLQRQNGQSLSATLTSMPGVQTLSQGHAVAKPMIRGMSNQRIVILKDGVRMEGQQWGGHHTPEADVLSVGRIEVVRGPMGLIYGSEALGGVIHLQSPNLPTLDDGAVPLKLAVRSGYQANSRQFIGGIGLQAAWPYAALRLSGSARNSEDYAAPAGGDFLKNVDGTAFRQESLNLQFVQKLKAHELEILGSTYQEEQTLIGEGHWHNTGGGEDGNEPWYHVLGKIISPTTHHNITLKGKWFMDHSWLEYDASRQHNHREGGPENEPPAVDIDTETYSANIRWRHVIQDRFPGTLGMSHMQKQSHSVGAERLLPDYILNSSGVYAYYRWKWSTITFTGGLRVDANRYAIEASSFPGISLSENVIKEYFPVPSGSVGFVWHEFETPYSIAMNVGTGWRPPNPYEMYINGVHHGDWKYEIGDPALEPEHSTNTDLILRHVAGTHIGELTLFYNHLDNYVVSAPTGLRDGLTGIPIYQIVQGNARTYGSEMRLEYGLAKHLVAELGWDAMWGEFLEASSDADGDGQIEKSLPSINPTRILGGLSYKLDRVGWFDDININLQIDHTFAQTNLAEYENVISDGYGGTLFIDPAEYTLLDFAIHGNLDIRGHSLDMSLGVKNLMNTQYYSHLSRYKGLVYNQGINLFGEVRITI